MKPDDLTSNQFLWLRRAWVLKQYGYVVSWHLRQDFGYTTSQINQVLTRVANKGYLVKESHKTHTKFIFTDKAESIMGRPIKLLHP